MGGAMVHSGWTSRAASRVARAKHRLMAACLVAAIATTPSAYGQLRDSAAKLIARTMGNPEFRPKSFRGGTWLGNGDFYLDLERSEEHTSELQSRLHLVCRLLLEKKKIKHTEQLV